MAGPRLESDTRWLKPIFEPEGQDAFWSRQAPGYDTAEMTNDNSGELALVRDFCADFVRRGYRAEDVVTLGGATGVRDPVVVTDALEFHGHRVRGVVFNDLSGAMVEAALRGALKQYEQKEIGVQTFPGPIHRVTTRMPHMPRRVIIGVYRANALLEASPAEGFTHSGLEEYLQNSKIMGENFIVDAVRFAEAGYESIGVRCALSAGSSPEEISIAAASLRSCAAANIDALQVASWHKDLPGFFSSHWYSERGIMQLVRETFGSEEARRTVVRQCAKGYVLCIDPIGQPRGIVTVLNNVIGNVLPVQQAQSLRAIHELSA